MCAAAVPTTCLAVHVSAGEVVYIRVSGLYDEDDEDDEDDNSNDDDDSNDDDGNHDDETEFRRRLTLVWTSLLAHECLFAFVQRYLCRFGDCLSRWRLFVAMITVCIA